MKQIVFQRRESCLVDKSILETIDLCLICQDICCKPLECLPCKSVLCEICTIKWKQNSAQCPNRCSSSWKLQKIEIAEPKLHCPYSLECEILDLCSFEEHLLTCNSAPLDVKKLYRLREQYRCVNDHKLVFNCQRFTSTYLSKCFQCGQFKYCKNQCLTCKYFYCGNCRLPPLTKKWCPAKEHIHIHKAPHPGFTCQRCKLQPLVLGKKCYDDMSCNFGLCETCYDRLPDRETQKQITTITSGLQNLMVR